MADNAGLTLEERVAALEERLAPPATHVELSFPEQWTEEQAEEFKRQFADGKWRTEQPRFLPGYPLLTPELARALLRECVTVVQPGETLVIRAPGNWTPRHVEEYQRYADIAWQDGRISFKVLVVIGDELAVAKPEPAPLQSPGSLTAMSETTGTIVAGGRLGALNCPVCGESVPVETIPPVDGFEFVLAVALAKTTWAHADGAPAAHEGIVVSAADAAAAEEFREQAAAKFAEIFAPSRP